MTAVTTLQPCPVCHAGDRARWRCAFCAPAPRATHVRWPAWTVAAFAVALLVAAVVFGVEAVLLGAVSHDPSWKYASAAAGACFVAALLALQVGWLRGELAEAEAGVTEAERVAVDAARLTRQVLETQPIDLALTRPIQSTAGGPRRARRPDAGRITVNGAITVGLLLVLAATFYGLLGGLWQHVVDPICQAAQSFCGGSR